MTTPQSDSSSSKDKLLFIVFIVAATTLVFLTGAVLTALGVSPGPQIARAVEGGKAIYAKLTLHDDVYMSDLWNAPRSEARGVTVNRQGRVSPGAILYTSGHAAAAYLISADGEVLHEWNKPFSQIWNEQAAVRDPQPDSHVYMRKARLLANGDILAVYEGAGDTPYGYGLVRLDRDSNIVWSYLESAHHDFDVAPDGRIVVLTQEIVNEPLPQLEHIKSPRLDDFLVVLSADGKEERKIPLLRVVDESRYRQLLFGISSFALADALHSNSVRMITEEDANFRFGKPGQVLISFREPGAIGVIDLEEERLVWAVRGYWIAQHDPQILPNGNILMFDNRGNFNAPEGPSRALEFDPVTMAIVWQYGGTESTPLFSAIRSYAVRLGNGNTLITESSGGRIIEVSADGEVVWEFVNPVRGGPDGKIPIICKAYRPDDEFTASLLASD